MQTGVFYVVSPKDQVVTARLNADPNRPQGWKPSRIPVLGVDRIEADTSEENQFEVLLLIAVPGSDGLLQWVSGRDYRFDGLEPDRE